MRQFMRLALASGAAMAVCAVSCEPVTAQAGGLYDGGPVYDAGPMPSQGLFQGWWIGGTLGANFDSTEFKNIHTTVDSNGVIGGVTGGYNWQQGPIVIGIEGDVMPEGVSGTHGFDGGAYKMQADQGVTGDLRFRVGVTVMPQLLLFGTLGASVADGSYKILGLGSSADDTMFGWSVGAGAETALSNKWSARFDYQFTNFDSDTVTFSKGVGKQHVDPDSNSFRGSLIYHF